MSRAIPMLLCAFTLFSAAAVFSAENADPPLGTPDFSLSRASLHISTATPALTSISLNSPDVIVQDQVLDFQTFQVFGIQGEPFAYGEGAPSIPQITRLYRIPNTGGVDLRILDAEYDVMDNVNVLPQQDEEKGFQAVTKDQSIYSRDEWYPQEIATISQPMILRDFRVVTVTLYPVQVNPVTHQARVYHTLNVDVVANDQPGFDELTNPRRPSAAFAPIYRSVIANLDDNALDDAATTPGSYLILSTTNTQMLPLVDSLRVWKTRRGYNVIVDSRSNWDATSMRSRIQALYASSNPALEFVCLMGDPSASGFGVPTDLSGSPAFYDHGFALGNNNDDLEDIGVGRLSGSNPTEMQTINAKIMGYERTPFMDDTTWYTRAFCYAGVTPNHPIASNYRLMLWSAAQFRNLTGVRNPVVGYYDTGEHVDDNAIRTQFNTGISFYFWRGTWLSQTDASLAGTCNSGWKLPVCLCVTCGANEFVGGTGIAESFLLAGTPTSPKGGVCAIGSTTSITHAPQNLCVSGGLIYNIINLGVESIGNSLSGAKVWLTLTFGANSTPEQQFSRINNLMGEPSLSMWTQVPVVMNATAPLSVNVGARNMQVLVTRGEDNTPIADARVVLWKGTETFVQGLTNASGLIDLPITINTPGDLLLTVTKRNHKPYLATIPCVSANLMVARSSYTLDDDNVGGTSGNGDGVPNPGETIDLPVYLRNFGSSTTATGVSATLSSLSPHITVLSAASTYPNIAAGDSALPATNFRIHIAPAMEDAEPALLNLSVTASSLQTTSSLELDCVAGNLNIVSAQFSQPFAPGNNDSLAITVRNDGHADMTGVTAQIISLSPFVSVLDNAGTFGNISINQQTNNNSDKFFLRAHALTYVGHQVPILLVSTTSTGAIDTARYVVSVGSAAATDPTGPDPFGYYAYDNSDVNYDQHPDYNYVSISASGTNLALNDPGEMNSVGPITSVARRLPFPFTFYGHSYDTITVCSNGWCAFGNQAFFDGWRSYPIPAMVAPDAMIAPYWDDLQTTGGSRGVWDYYDAANHRYIIQWKAVGTYATTTNLDFEVILQDTSAYPTVDGNGNVIIQYNQVQMNLQGDDPQHGSAVGIQAPGGTVGLPYAYQTTYTPGAAVVTTGRAIRFTTEARALYGTIRGQALNAANNQPLAGVNVSVDGYYYHATTDVSGYFFLNRVLIGTYSVRGQFPRFNETVVNNVVVAENDTVAVNLNMLHPEIALSVDSIHVTVPSQPSSTSFNINNAGNGTLDYSISIAYAPSGTLDDPWDRLGNVDVSGQTNDHSIQGCEWVNDHWVASGGGADGVNRFYDFDFNGQLTNSFPQPGSSAFGWFDMAFDGTYLYGSDNHVITGVDPNTGAAETTIPSPLNPSRAIAYDSTTHNFWIADYASAIYEITRQGAVVDSVPNGLMVTGLAWHPTDADGYHLYIFSENGNPYTQVSKMQTTTHDVQVVTNIGTTGDHAGGCTITPGWNSTLLVFGAIIKGGDANDRLSIYELAFNTTWISINPTASTVPGGSSGLVNVVFNPSELRGGVTYRVNMSLHSTILDTTLVRPIALTVEATDIPEQREATIPSEYALDQNYPNPFNPTTMIRYDLKAAGHTKLVVYNVMGQRVATLVDAVQPAGSYHVMFDANHFGSGLYFYKLESGNFVKVSKMVLLK